MPRRPVILGLIILSAASGVSPQPPRRQTPGAYRVEVTEVPVDVVVTDGRGRPVLDLVRDDFVLLENGAPQEIKHFSLQVYGGLPSAPPPPAPPPSASQPAVVPESPQHRTMLIMLGRGRHRFFNCLPRLIRFVRHDLSPDDRVAVMAFNRATDFTTDHEKVAETLELYDKKSAEVEAALELRQRGLSAIYGSRELPDSLQRTIDEIFAGSGLTARRLLPSRVDEANGRTAEDQEIHRIAERLQSTAETPSDAQDSQTGQDLTKLFDKLRYDLTVGDLPFDEYVASRQTTEQDIEHIYAAIEYLRFMQGEKHLIFLTSEGLTLSRVEHERGLASMASDARVRIHTIQTGGVYLGLTNAADLDLDSSARTGVPQYPGRLIRGTVVKAFALDSLRNIADMTGGQSFINTDFDQAFRRLNEATSAAYLLSYTPQNTNFDGRYRSIQVRLNRKGLRVHHRRGYYAHSTLVPYDRDQFMTFSRTSAALRHQQPLSDVDFSLEAEVKGRGGPTAILVKLRIHPQASVYRLSGERRLGNLNITFFLMADDGQMLRETWDDLDMALLEPTYQRIMNKGLSLDRTLELDRPVRDLRLMVVIYDPANDRLGSKSMRLR